MCVRVGVCEHDCVCKWACGCVHACVGGADGWVQEEFSMQGFNSCDFFLECQLPQLLTKPKDIAHQEQSPAEAPGPSPSDLPLHLILGY